MSNSEHMVLDGKAKADLYYRKGYRQKGHSYISGGSRKSCYSKTNQIKAGLEELGIKKKTSGHGDTPHHERYYLPYLKNFKNTYAPYKNQAHHLLPQKFWKKMNPEQKKILRQIKYSINNGENIIFLPENERGQTIHKLPIHCGPHFQYSEAVIEGADKIKKKIQKAVKEAKKCKSNKPSDTITEDLMNLQGDYWNAIVNSDERYVNEVVVEDQSGL